MQVKLVVDNENIAELPIGNLMDIAGMARRVAEQIDDGEFGDVTRALVIIETPDGLTLLGWGENTGPYEAMGLYEAAKLQTFADFVSIE